MSGIKLCATKVQAVSQPLQQSPEEKYLKRHFKLLSAFYIELPSFGLRLFENDVNEQQKGTLMTLLHYACQFGDKEEIEELLAAGANVFIRDSNGNFPLHYLAAAAKDDVEIFKLIYEKVNDNEQKKKLITTKNDTGFTAFCCAVESSNFCIAEYLEMELKKFDIDFGDQFSELKRKTGIALENKYNKLSSEHSDMKALLRAVEAENIEDIKKLIQINGSHMTALNYKGYDALRIAISHDHVENIKLLLPYFCLNGNAYQQNIFFVAIKHNSIKVIEYLLSAADTPVTEKNFLDDDDFKDGTVMDLCKTKLLFEQDVSSLRTPLHGVAETGNAAIFQIIVEFYKDINFRDRNLQTPLHIAAENKNSKIFMLILRRSLFALFLNDINGETPFSIICRNNSIDLLEFVAENTILFTNVNRRKYVLNVAMKTHCMWLLNLMFRDIRYIGDKRVKTLFEVSARDNKLPKSVIDIYQDTQASLKVAIKEGFTDGVLFLLHLDNFDIIFRRQYPSKRNPDPRSPMQLLIEYMPEMAKTLFDQCFIDDKHFINYGLINDDFYIFNDLTFEKFVEQKKLKIDEKDCQKIVNSSFTNANEKVELIIHDNKEPDESEGYQEIPFSQTLQTHPITLMIKYEHFSLLSHPLVKSYIDLKWNRFAKWSYYSACFYYLCIAVGLTILTIFATPRAVDFYFINKNDEVLSVYPNNTFSGAVITITFIFQCGFLLARLKLNLGFVKDYWFELITLGLTMFASLPICLHTDFQIHWNIIVVLNFCASITLLNYIKKHPRFGVYVVMITYVFSSFLKFAPIFFMVLLPFVVLFYVLLGKEFGPFGIPKKNGLFAFFDTFIHTLVMMTGEFDYKNSISSKYSFVTSAMFGLFLFAVTIFLMNLLTGLAVSDTTKIMQEAVIRRRIMQIETIHHVEMIMPKWIKKRLWDGYCKDPKDVKEMKEETHRITTFKFRKLFKWLGMSKADARKINSGNVVEDKLDALKQEMNQSINNLNEKFNDLNDKMTEIMEMLKHR